MKSHEPLFIRERESRLETTMSSLAKGNEDQPRDDHGRFAGGDGTGESLEHNPIMTDMAARLGGTVGSLKDNSGKQVGHVVWFRSNEMRNASNKGQRFSQEYNRAAHNSSATAHELPNDGGVKVRIRYDA